MAGDWIKWAKGLQDKPEVFRMSIELSLDRYSVAGRLMVVWAWADDNVPSSSVSENGDASVALGAQQKQLVDAVAGVPGFADSMSAAGWLSQRNGSLVFPNFARHNGETAKTRVLAAERMKKSRTKRNTGCAPTVTKAQPEKSRVEKNKEPPPQTTPAIPPDDPWSVVVVDLTELGMSNPEKVAETAKAGGWTPEAVKAMADHFTNYREAEGWKTVGILRSKLLAKYSGRRPAEILTLTQSGRAPDARGQYEDLQRLERDRQDRERRSAAAEADRQAAERLERYGPQIDAMSIEERQELVQEGWYRQQVMIRGKDWRGARLLMVALLAAMERRQAAEA